MISNQNYQVLRAFGHEAHVIVASEQTKGAFCIVRFFAPAGYSVPLHTHHFEDETFLVESGELEVNRGGQMIHAQKGDVIYLPKDIPHSPKAVGNQNLQVIAICVPGGFDHYLAACAEEWSKPEPNLEYLDEIAARFGQEFHSLRICIAQSHLDLQRGL